MPNSTPAATSVENPLTIHTMHGLGVLGAMIRRWCLDPSTRSPSVASEAGRVVIRADTFRELMAQGA